MWWSYPIESDRSIHMGPLHHSWCWFPANAFTWSLHPECMTVGTPNKASASVWTLVMNLQQMFFLLIFCLTDPIRQSSLTLYPALLSLSVFLLLLFGGILDAVFASFLSASRIDSRQEAPHGRPQLSPRAAVRELPRPYPSQEKGISQLLLTMIHLSQKAVRIAHDLNEQSREQQQQQKLEHLFISSLLSLQQTELVLSLP